MIFSILVICLVGIIVYFHYLQGLFSAALSAFMAVVAALVALSFHEVVVNTLLKGYFADQAHAIVLVSLFAVTYILLRAIFDQYLPGNVTFPLWVDRIGAPVMGLVAGLFGVGVLVIAAQTLPFGPSVAGYQRFEMNFAKAMGGLRLVDRTQQVDAVFDELKEPENFLQNTNPNKLLIPVDDLVLSFISFVSEPGQALDAGKPFRDVHPDYLQELFGQRVGIQSGSKHTAMNGKSEVMGVFSRTELTQTDQERFEVDGAPIGARAKSTSPPELPQLRRPQPGRMLLIVRARFHRDDADEKSSHFAFSPASIRLVANRKNYFPIGTLEAKTLLYVNTPEDYLFAQQDKGADLVFEVEENDLLVPNPAADPKAGAIGQKLSKGVFLEIKRMARIELGGMTIGDMKDLKSEQNAVLGMVRKEGTGSTALAKDATLSVGGSPLKIARDLPSPMQVGTIETEVTNSQMAWGRFSLKERKFSKMEVDPVQSTRLMATGDQQAREFYTPEGSLMVQLNAKPKLNLENKWAWADAINDFGLTDGNGKRHTPVGVIVKLKNDTTDTMFIRYDPAKPLTSISPQQGMRPTDVILLYAMPSGTEIKSLDFKDEVMLPLQLQVR